MTEERLQEIEHLCVHCQDEHEADCRCVDAFVAELITALRAAWKERDQARGEASRLRGMNSQTWGNETIDTGWQ